MQIHVNIGEIFHILCMCIDRSSGRRLKISLTVFEAASKPRELKFVSIDRMASSIWEAGIFFACALNR